MPSLRIIYDNTADRATSLTASSTAGSLAASNMQTNIKGRVHRSTGLSVTYTLTWSSGEVIGGVALPATNLSGDATIRVQLYSDTGCTSQIADSGTILACPGADLDLWNWSLPLNANAFSFGGASKTSVWFQNHYTAYGCKITLTDSAANTSGYIDCARIVCGQYWEPINTVQNGSLNIEPADLSTKERNDAGDLIASRSIKHDKLRFDLAYLQEVDRQAFMHIARKAGTSNNILVSIFNDTINSVLAQDSTIYGKVVNFATTQQFYGFYSTPLEIEGW
jgi:hypothetical protein